MVKNIMIIGCCSKGKEIAAIASALERAGKTVVVVADTGHKKEEVIDKTIESILISSIERYDNYTPIEKQSHKRPYKFHR